MNKKLIALAIASAISAPAMAATGNVDIYGLLSVGVDSVQNGDNTALTHDTNRVGRFSDYASRIGFKGSEDLGNGLSAIWQIEQQINVDNNAGNGGAFGGANLRNTFVGLKSKDLGSVLGGRYDTPYKVATGRLDPFADTLGDYNGVVGAATNAGAAVGAGSYFDQRPSNVVDYISPSWSGLSVAAAYAFGAETAVNNVAVTDKNANLYSLAAMYDAGPLFLSAAYEKQNFGTGGANSVGTFGAVANTDQSAYKIGAGYSIMDFTLGALYEKTKDNFGTGGANLLGHSTWYLSGKYQMGAVALKAAYGKANSNATANTGAKLYTVGADYSFSKRTTVYALYTQIKNDTNAGYNFAYNAASGIGAGDKPSGFSLGMKHAF
ncbi:porin [Sulfuriferula sp.]|uniref:porin n=1 Tax=Sulfuriferula sp. TaxID=2025307 RepID=UPI0027309F45|nr:porin [Sulfuriferula sp.]MDP2025212.1 porin [Sulfuriferula sp.]